VGGVEWLASCPRCFTSEKRTLVTHGRRLGGPQNWSGREEGKNHLSLPGYEPQIIKPVA